VKLRLNQHGQCGSREKDEEDDIAMTTHVAHIMHFVMVQLETGNINRELRTGVISYKRITTEVCPREFLASMNYTSGSMPMCL
jgi:hypothetical protein